MTESGPLRVGVYNRFWATAGGGEKFAGGIAQALASRHEVTLIGHGHVDLVELADRLQLDLAGIGWRAVEVSPTAVEAASADFELFINVSYGSVLANRAAHGLYVVHFPTIGAPAPRGWRRFALRATGRLARLTGTDLEPARWAGGVYAPEPLGPLTHRWTDGEGQLQLAGLIGASRTDVGLGAGRRGRVITLVLGPPAQPVSRRDVEVVDPAGRRVAAGTLRARTRRWSPPISFLSGRLAPARGPVRLRVHSATNAPGGRARDHRLLGVSVVAVLVGPWYRRLLQLVHQPLAAAAADLSFLDSYQRVVANSRFTATWVQRLWGIDAGVLNPPVGAQPAGDKHLTILHVGRFFAPEAGHSKRQLELVEAFARLVGRGGAPGWTLHLVGGCDQEGMAYLDTVRAAIARAGGGAAGGGLAVQLHVNASAAELRELFAHASIYWHATGLGEDPEIHPERMEHFGISTVEAMSAGAVPVVIGQAGQLEVLDDGVEGYHFADLDELVARTEALIADPARLAALSVAARTRAGTYGEAAFRRQLLALVDGLTATAAKDAVTGLGSG